MGEKSCSKKIKKNQGKILESLSSGKRRAFLAKGVAKMHGRQAAEKRRIEKVFQKIGCQVFLFKEIILGHPCIPRVRVDKGSDKRPGLRKKGRSWREGGGGERGRGHIRGTKG